MKNTFNKSWNNDFLLENMVTDKLYTIRKGMSINKVNTEY